MNIWTDGASPYRLLVRNRDAVDDDNVISVCRCRFWLGVECRLDCNAKPTRLKSVCGNCFWLGHGVTVYTSV